jgi:uncharacterized protein
MKIDLRPLRAERGGTLMVGVREAMASGLADVPFLTSVEGDLVLANQGATLRIDGALATTVTLTCDRCARPFQHALRAAIHDDLDWTAPGEGFLAASGEAVTLDVDAMAREALLLEMPMVSRCDPDCKGLCDQCGADLRIEPCRCAQRAPDAADHAPADPRWGPLAAWPRGDDSGRR